jgi:uncharacterized protein YgbK (DUF1537 family)
MSYISKTKRQIAFYLLHAHADALDVLAPAHGRTRSEEACLAIEIHLVNHALSMLVTPEGRAQVEAEGHDADADRKALKERLAQLCAVAYAAPRTRTSARDAVLN